MPQSKFFQNVREFALYYGAGGMVALQAMKLNIFYFPPTVRLYLSLGFSLITIFCVFLSGPTLKKYMDKITDVTRQTKAIDNSIKQEDESVTPK